MTSTLQSGCGVYYKTGALAEMTDLSFSNIQTARQGFCKASRSSEYIDPKCFNIKPPVGFLYGSILKNILFDNVKYITLELK